ncbi:MAG TPA: LysR family transcriptional regulator, partial [Solirubrobacteraceae bacterium]
MLDVRRLRVFDEVARRGSFAAAAAYLHFSQSAVSQQIAVLEREAGTQLVERQARGVSLTPAGRLLREHAHAILSGLEDAESDLRLLADGPGGRLRLGAVQAAGAEIVPPAAAEMRRRFPAVELHVTNLDSDDLLDLVRAGALELALTVVPAPDDTPAERGLQRIDVLVDKLHVLLPAAHPAAALDEVSLRHLATEPWVDDVAGHTSGLLEREGASRVRVALVTDDHLVAQGYVAAGMAVALAPSLMTGWLRPGVCARPLAQAPQRAIQLVRRRACAAPAVAAMADVIHEIGARFAAAGAAAAR